MFQLQSIRFNLVTESPAVRKGSEEEIFGLRPRYLRHNLWTPDTDPKLVAAVWTHTARPLPRPPHPEIDNLAVRQTLEENPDLFKIVTLIKVDVLRRLTQSHPNRPFVESVLEGFTHGFWPWTRTLCEGYPLTHDESRPLKLSPEKEEFLRKQIQHERDLDRQSESFGKTLLPGMYCMPHYIVPKPHSTDWRLVNDLSAGPYSLNSMVDHQFITGYPLDNLSHLGEMLLRKWKEKPGNVLVLWKSDISEAYRVCPMHKLWQMKQVIRFSNDLCVDRVNMFGGSPSGSIFIAFNSLVAWVARFVRLVESLVYVDDSFGAEDDGQMELYSLYSPYNQWYPVQQLEARLLNLWDELGIPHKQKKQLFGSRLSILGIEVNANSLTFSLPQESKDRLQKSCRRGVRKE